MRISHIKCPACGKPIDLDWDWSYFLCQYCRAKCVILSHNHPETPQETLERLHGEAWQSIEDGKYAMAYEQYREILQHRIDDGEAWHGRALAIGLLALDKENLRAGEVIASFDEGLRRDPTPRSKLLFALHAVALAKRLHAFHYLHFRREPLHTLRWKYYRNASDFALRMLRKCRGILQELCEMPEHRVMLLLKATDGYVETSVRQQAEKCLHEAAQITADIDRALLTSSLRLHGKKWTWPKWYSIPAEEKTLLRQEYRAVSEAALGTASQPPVSEFWNYWKIIFIYLAISIFVILSCYLFAKWALLFAGIFAALGFFGFLLPIRNRFWEKHCYASDVRAGVYDYK